MQSRSVVGRFLNGGESEISLVFCLYFALVDASMHNLRVKQLMVLYCSSVSSIQIYIKDDCSQIQRLCVNRE